MPGSLPLGLFISLIGVAAFAYGRRSSRLVPLIGGVILMIFPYFVPNALAMAVIGASIVLAIVLFRDVME